MQYYNKKKKKKIETILTLEASKGREVKLTSTQLFFALIFAAWPNTKSFVQLFFVFNTSFDANKVSSQLMIDDISTFR